jgi:hypothetical protein
LTTYRLSPDCATHIGQTWRFTGLVMDFDILIQVPPTLLARANEVIE